MKKFILIILVAFLLPLSTPTLAKAHVSVGVHSGSHYGHRHMPPPPPKGHHRPPMKMHRPPMHHHSNWGHPRHIWYDNYWMGNSYRYYRYPNYYWGPNVGFGFNISI